jgi:hypothetical protein
VELIVILLCGGRGGVGVPIENELDEMGGRDGQRFNRGKRFEQSFEAAGEFSLMLIECGDEFFGGTVTPMLEQVLKLGGLMRFGWSEIALNVEIANVSGGAAEFAEQLARLFGWLAVWGKIG